jgi:hypothetical protein
MNWELTTSCCSTPTSKTSVVMEFYTYEYLRADGSPYYVGKGSNGRAWVSRKGHRPPEGNRIRIKYWPDEATAFAYEIYQIDFWGRKDLGTGILRNRTDGGQGIHWSEERRRRQSEALKGNTNCLGYRHSEDTIREMRISRRGRKPTIETRRKMSVAFHNFHERTRLGI